ncbi:MAG: hypothetical protein NZL92_07330 [Gloeomargarita sp. SKYG116]|nr:hypothetical protein [Gloeomargarita sp. SKYG116]MDW8401491.1 hypothetical protein [Gloeomargarita sp. SKYGB_i_bin116]
MNQITLLRQLEMALQDPRLVLQVALAAPYLQVVVNRTGDRPDYPALSRRIAELVGQMDLPEIQYVAVYGRVYGQEEVEYEESLPLLKTPVTVLSTENPFVAAAAEPEPFTLAKYCFTRNRSLLTASLPSPKLSIAELIRDFHGFTDTEKQAILEELGKFLRNPDAVNTQTWSEIMRAWLGRARSFSDEDMRSFAIWMSRYCADPEKTLETARATIKAAKEAEKERRRQEREARLAERKTAHSTTRSSFPPATTRPVTIPPQATPIKPSASPIAKLFALLVLVVLTIAITIIGQAITFSVHISDRIIFALTLLGGWYLGLCNEIQFLILGRVSLKALIIHFLVLILALIPATIIYFITLLIFPWLAYAWVGGSAGAMIGSICRSMVRALGDSEEYELMKFARFRGFAKQAVGVSFVVLLMVTLIGATYKLDLSGLYVTPPGKTLEGFSEATCEELVARVENDRLTVQEAIDLLGANATEIISEVRAARPGYVWNYENAEVVLLADEIDRNAVIDVVAVCMVCHTEGVQKSCSGLNILERP